MTPVHLIRPIRERLDADGYVAIPGALPPALVHALRHVMERLRDTGVPPSRQVLYTHAPPPGTPPGMERLMDQWLNPHRRTDASSALAVDPIRTLADALLPSPAILFQDVLMEKTEAHAPFPWHQDLPYWPVDRTDGLIVWVALDDVDAGSGGVRFLRGSHRSGAGPAIDLHTGAPQEGTGTTSGVPPEGAEDCPSLQAGDAVAFHALAWHSSSAKRGGARRRAWATSWLSSGTRWNVARAPRHPLAQRMIDGEVVREWER